MQSPTPSIRERHVRYNRRCYNPPLHTSRVGPGVTPSFTAAGLRPPPSSHETPAHLLPHITLPLPVQQALTQMPPNLSGAPRSNLGGLTASGSSSIGGPFRSREPRSVGHAPANASVTAARARKCRRRFTTTSTRNSIRSSSFAMGPIPRSSLRLGWRNWLGGGVHDGPKTLRWFGEMPRGLPRGCLLTRASGLRSRRQDATYVLQGVAPGTVTVIVTFANMEPKPSTLTLAAGQRAELDLALTGTDGSSRSGRKRLERAPLHQPSGTEHPFEFPAPSHVTTGTS